MKLLFIAQSFEQFWLNVCVCIRPQFRAGGSTSHKGPVEDRAGRPSSGGTRYDITLIQSEETKITGTFVYKTCKLSMSYLN